MMQRGKGDSKKSKCHYEAAAMAGHEGARFNLGCMEAQSGNMGQAVKHWVIAALSSTCRMSACRFFAQTATFCVVSATGRRHVSVMSQTQENVVSARVSKRHDI